MHSVSFAKGTVSSPLKKVSRAKRRHRGTTITFKPDKTFFGAHRIKPAKVRERLLSVAFLCPTLRVTFSVNDKKEVLTKKKGLQGLLIDKMGDSEKSMFKGGPLMVSYVGTFKERDGKPVFVIEEGGNEGLDFSLHWTSGLGEEWYSYVNMIRVPEGGTHVTGAKNAITRILSKQCKKKGVIGDDFREGLRVVMHVKLAKPHFEGQSKRRLNNPECRGMTSGLIRTALRRFFGENGDLVTAIVTRAEAMSKARASMKASRSIASQEAYSTTEGRKGLPAKLYTALRCAPEDRELFIVEGDSAGGCFAANTKVRLSGGGFKTFAELVDDFAVGIDHQGIAFNAANNAFVEFDIAHPRVTKTVTEVIELEFDDGSVVQCTPDHRFLLDNGQYKAAKDLDPTDTIRDY